MERYRSIIPNFASFLDTFEQPQPQDIRINTILSSREEVLDTYSDVLTPRDFDERFFIFDGEPGKTVAHWRGAYYVQEATSGLPPLVLEPEPGERVLDMCAAPGSKTSQMAAMMENTGELVANDVSGNRLRGLLSNTYRTGCVNTTVTERDGRTIPEDQQFDKVLVDAPCTGEGNARDQDELRDGVDPAKARDLAGLQRGLLKKALRLCKPDGEIVYSTCTFAPEENEMVVDAVLDEASLVPIDMPCDHTEGITAWQGTELASRLTRTKRVYPHQLDAGGIFIARLTPGD